MLQGSCILRFSKCRTVTNHKSYTALLGGTTVIGYLQGKETV